MINGETLTLKTLTQIQALVDKITAYFQIKDTK